MSLLSKAEIQYLEGHKQLSKTYERKMKCLIRKKVKGLKKDIFLLSKLIPISQIFDSNDPFISNISDTGYQTKSVGNIYIPATKISNSNTSVIGATDNSSSVKTQ